MYKYPVTDSGFKLTLGYLGYFEVLEWNHELEDLFKRRQRLRSRLIRLEEELLLLQKSVRRKQREFQFRRGCSVLSFSNKMSLPTSRPRTRQSEPVRPASRQTPIREKTSIASRPGSRQTVQRPTSFAHKKEIVTPRKSSTPTVIDTNLDQAYKHAAIEGEIKPLWYRDSDSNSGKLQAPVLPSMRLQRETTSFGVYSNLASHNRNGSLSLDSFDEERLPEAEGVQLKVLEAVKANDVAQLCFVLDSNPKLKLAFSDEDGDSVLHSAIKSLNADILEIVLSRNVSLDWCDPDGRNILHLAASKGLLQMVDLLLKKGLGINSLNKANRRTALHEAIQFCHSDIVEFLLLCGINPEIKDKAGQTAASYCSPKYPKKEFDKTLSTVASTKIDVEKLHHSQITKFSNTCLAINTTTHKQTDDPVMVCKRQGADQCGLTFSIQDTDDVISDVFMYRFLEPVKEPLPAVVTLPIQYAPRSSKEELKIKTDNGLTLSPSDVNKDSSGWLCQCNTKLEQSGAFVVVCRPAIEEITVEKENRVLTLSTDSRVKVSIPRGAFNRTSDMTLQVLEPSDDTEIEENQILSSTPFYKIQSSVTPSKPVTVELPVPDDYGQGNPTETVVLMKVDGHQDWHVKENIQTHSNTTISFSTKDLPLHAVVVKTVPSYKKETLSKEINDIFKQMTTRDFTISFLCMSKRSIKANKFFMVVECCDQSMLETRRRVWTSKGYIEQKQKEPLDRFSASPKQAFNVVFYDNIVTRKNKRADILRYHPKRDSAVMFELPDDVPLVSARIFIYKTDSTVVGGNSLHAEDIVENRKELLKSIDVMKIDIAREKTVLRPESILDSVEKNSKHIVFLTDSLIEELIVEMNTEWYKICILMGVTFRQVENSLVIEGKLKNKIKELIQAWRNEKQSREDIGLPLLMSALFKGGHRNIANLVQIELKKWYGSVEDKDSPFYQWVTKAYKDSDLLVPSDYPKPMSDEYLVLMADDLSPSRELARTLNLTDTEIDEILHSKNYPQDGIKVMKMLTLFRDNISNRIDSLQRLVACLNELGFEKMKKYSVMCARAWLKRTATRKDDPLRYQVDAYLKKLQ